MGLNRTETEFMVAEMVREDGERPVSPSKKESRAAILSEARKLLQSIHSDDVDGNIAEEHAEPSHAPEEHAGAVEPASGEADEVDGNGVEVSAPDVEPSEEEIAPEAQAN